MPGVNTWIRLVPSEQLTIVVLANADNRLSHTVADKILHLLVPDWKIPQPGQSLPADRKSFELPPELVGVWKGAVSTYQSDIPLTVRIQQSGDIHIELGN